MPWNKILALPVTAVVLLGTSGCAFQDAEKPSASPLRSAITQEPAPASNVLLAEANGAFSAINTANNEVGLSSQPVLISPTGALLYEHRRPSVTITDLATLKPVGRTSAPKGMELEVASTSERYLAFSEPHESGASSWIPAPRARTRITVVPTDGASSARTYDLKGNFDIEAFSTDDRQLFLIEYMPAQNPWHYGLRRLGLENGNVRDIARAKQNAPGEMNGTGRLSLFSPAGHELYTLYTQQGPNYTHTAPDDAHSDEVYAFVHLLNLEGAWTHCIDLPAPFGTGPVSSHAMAVSQDGSRLYVADPSSGGLAVIDPRTQRVLRSVTVDLRALREGVSASVGGDGALYLAGGRRVLIFDGSSMLLLREITLDHSVSGIATSPDASRIYVSSKTGIDVLDSATGRRIRTI
jgi:YVTN family beta-propeller protein